MPTFEAGDIVRVPFPYTNRETTQRRPALVISDGALATGMFLWVAMVTSAENRGWPSDVIIEDPQAETGLPIPSVVRLLKIAGIEAAVASPLGRLGSSTLSAVRAELLGCLGLSRP